MSGEFSFRDLRELFAKANEEKSGDQLARLAAGSDQERVAAKRKLADLPLATIVQQPLIDPDEDNVSRVIADTFDEEAFRPIKSMTGGEFRGELLMPAVAVLLIGERPGLATAESLSAYMAYRPHGAQTDADRNLISNIHARGVNPGDAATRILQLAAQMMSAKVGGTQLREEPRALRS
jgi:Ethanolamine ammonia lyase large subunit (EutB)/Ethanolamine ammonia-lyase light chain (EutC)